MTAETPNRERAAETTYAGTRFVYVVKLAASAFPAESTFPADVGHWSCQRCGAQVSNTRTHGDWHAEMDRSTGRVEGLGL